MYKIIGSYICCIFCFSVLFIRFYVFTESPPKRLRDYIIKEIKENELMECWHAGTMKCRNVGIKECRIVGMKECRKVGM